MNWRRWKHSPLAFVAMGLPMVVMAQAMTYPTNDFFNWAEKEYGFPQGSATAQYDYKEIRCIVDYRYYGNEYYLGVCRSDGHIYSLNKGVLVKYYPAEKHKCDARPDLCAPASFAGTVVYSNEGGTTSATIAANYKGNKLWGVGLDGKGAEIPSNEIEALCAHSLRLGNWGRKDGPGCNPPQGNGELRLLRLPGNDCHRLTAWWQGKEYWFDHDVKTGYKVTGLNAKLNQNCGIEYGPNGFTPAKISAVREPDGTASLVWDFGSDFVGGIFREVVENGVKKGVPVVFDLENQSKVYAFVLNGSHTGKDYGDGWGLGDGRKTPEGFLIQPSVKMAWLILKDGRRSVKFPNVACADAVNITAYVGTGPADKVVYDFGSDGFGLGWGSMAVFTAGDGVTINATTGKASYIVPFCTKK